LVPLTLELSGGVAVRLEGNARRLPVYELNERRVVADSIRRSLLIKVAKADVRSSVQTVHPVMTLCCHSMELVACGYP
jgi:hypothetical protein